MIKREEAISLIQKYVKNENLIKHMFAAEAVMKHFALKFNGNQDEWALAGLLHDIDVELTKDNPNLHGIKSAEILRENNIPENIINAITNHPKEEPTGDEMSKVLYSADQVTGLIIAAALIHPDKKLSSIDANFILNRFNEKRFAKGANREKIKKIEQLGISLYDFVDQSLKAMQSINKELGL